MTGQRLYQTLAVAIALLLLFAVVQSSLALTDGTLIYAIDDPYIHLEVAASLLRGEYGINPGEFSAPSSSIAYPMLLAALLALGAGTSAPLILGALGAVLAAWLIAGLWWRHSVDPDAPAAVALALVALLPLLYGVAVAGLPMTGMEHMLHLAAGLAVVAGLAQLNDTDRVPAWFVLAAVAAPLLRYEGLALTLPVIAVLLARQRLVAATAIALILALAMSGFSVFLHRTVGVFLPSSVLVKSVTIAAPFGPGVLDAESQGALGRIAVHALESIVHRSGTILAMGLALILFALARRDPRSDGRRIAVGLVVALAIAGQLALGRFDWFPRYQMYSVALLLAALIVLYGDFLKDPDSRALPKALAIVVGLATLAALNAIVAKLSPQASYNVYAQHAQMRRFATEHFRHPVAVNDVGLVAYDTDIYVLDLWGLASVEASAAARSPEGRAPEVLARMAEARGAVYAMIYTEWFDHGLPAGWCRVASLTAPHVSTGSPTVDFYLIDKSREAEMAAALDAFAPGLPQPTTFERYNCLAVQSG